MGQGMNRQPKSLQRIRIRVLSKKRKNILVERTLSYLAMVVITWPGPDMASYDGIIFGKGVSLSFDL